MAREEGALHGPRGRAALLAALVALALALAALAGQTLSARSAESRVDASARLAGVDARIVQTAPVPGGGAVEVPDGFSARGYGSHARVIAVENTGSHPVFVRIRLDVAAVDEDGARLSDAGSCPGADPSWVERDGWLYYLPALGAGQTTPPACTSVEIDERAAAGASRVELRVCGQGVQSENNAADALGAAGWPEEVSRP